jgi:DNA-binding NarL/FixJ family response regulator
MQQEDSLIKVLIVDDHEIVRQGLAGLIDQEPGFRTVGQCCRGEDVIEEALRLAPDVVVMDLAMPEMNGFEVCEQLRQHGVTAAVVILSMHSDERLVAKAISAGAAGYLTKECAPKHLLDAIRTVHAGGTYLGPGVPRPGIVSGGGRSDDPYHRLTPREQEILAMIGKGLDTRTIASRLNISGKTVGTHRVRIMRKLDIHHQVALARYAIERDGMTGGVIPSTR